MLKASAIVDLASGLSLQYEEEWMGFSSQELAAQRKIFMSSAGEEPRSRSLSKESTLLGRLVPPNIVSSEPSQATATRPRV